MLYGLELVKEWFPDQVTGRSMTKKTRTSQS